MRAVALSLLLAAGVAHANGRAPVTNGIVFHPTDPHSVYLRSTFGLLISHDDGCTFNWVCENNIGYTTSNYDPVYAIATDGSIFATTPNGLRVSRDGGCSFSTVTPDESVDALEIEANGDIWITTATGGMANDVFRSTDNGANFNPMGLSSTVVFYKSLKVAPSNPARVYVTSNQNTPPQTNLLRSDNTGGMWTTEPLTNVTLAPFPLVLVAAVDPANADIVYLVSSGANAGAGDLLYRSSDGGVTFTQVLSTANPIRNVVIADAQHVYVTTTIVQMNGSELGGPSFVSSNAGVAFGPLAGAPALDCLTKSPDGKLYGCGANWEPDYKAVALSTDGTTWSKVWRFVEMAGALSCPGGTVEHDVCDAQLWAGIHDQFGTTGPSVPCFAPVILDGATDGPPSGPGKSGCCSGSGGELSLVWAGVLALWLGRRRQ